MTLLAPVRTAAKLRPQVSHGLLLGSAATAAIFVATSFAVPDVVERYGVGVGAAAMISTAQVLGFTVTNLIAGRHLVPSAKMARSALVVMALANALSAVAPFFALLVALRLVCGTAMGLFTWIAWSDTAASHDRRGEVAATGPLTTVVMAPVLGFTSSWGGLSAMYAILAVICVACLAFHVEVQASITVGRRPIESRGVIPALLGMGAFTLGGSAVFVFVGVIALDRIGMTTLALSVAIMLNALAGVPAARFAGRRRFPGAFIALTGVCAVVLTQTDTTWLFIVAVTVWGLSFWMAVPEVYHMLSLRSRHPADRIGDAQAVMAMGRVIGPTVGGVLVAAGSFTVLGLAAGLIMVLGGVLVEYVAHSPETVI